MIVTNDYFIRNMIFWNTTPKIMNENNPLLSEKIFLHTKLPKKIDRSIRPISSLEKQTTFDFSFLENVFVCPFSRIGKWQISHSERRS